MPFADYQHDMQVIVAIIQGVRPTRPTTVGMYEDLWSLVTRCWEIEPSDRPSMKEVEDSVRPSLSILHWLIVAPS
jgi:hypothetical protein